MSETAKAHAAMLVFAFLVSTSFTIGRALTFALDPVPLTFLRFLMATLIFSGVAALSKQRFRLPRPADIVRYLFLALLLVVFFVTMFEGLRWTTPLNTGAVFTLVPVMTMLIALVVLRQRLSAFGLVCLIIASASALWIMFNGNLHNLLALRIGRGELIFLVGCATYAGYSPAVRKLHKDRNLVLLTLWTFVACCVLLLAYGWRAIAETRWLLTSPVVYLGVAWLAVFTTAITFYLIQYATVRLPSAKVMSYSLLIPAFILLQRLANGGSWPSVSVLAAIAVLIFSMLALQHSA